MENRVAIIGIIVEDTGAVELLNNILHQYGEYIIGRMGLPHPQRSINIISVAMDAPNDIISAMTGKLGRLNGVSAKATFSKL